MSQSQFKIHNECCNWALMFLSSSQTENMYHNQHPPLPPLIINKETNSASLYIHPKISLHWSLQWYIFKWKYIYIIFHSSLYCTVPFCPSIYAYIVVTLKESFESLESVACFVKKNVTWFLFYNIVSVSVVSALHVFHFCWPTTILRRILLKG